MSGDKGLIVEGVYFGTVTEYGLMEKKNGDPQAFVKVAFEAEYQNGSRSNATLTWFGGFTSEKAAAYTMKTLQELGYQSDDPRGLGGKGALPPNTEAKITVEHNTYEGKTTARIKYLNRASKFKAASAKTLSSLDWVASAVKKQKAEADPTSEDSDMPDFLK